MKQRVRSLVVGSYLLLCIVLGGSAQGVWGNLALQILGVALIAWSALCPREQQGRMLPAAIWGVLLASLIVVLLQLIPLPQGIWSKLPGRSAIAAGYTGLGIHRPDLAISETPYRTISTLFAVIPALAVLLATCTLRPSQRWLAVTVLAGAIAGTLAGAAQVAGGHDSWAYLYRITNSGAVGFFANQNHMATLLLIAIPMTAAIISAGQAGRRAAMKRYAIGAALMVVILTGIALNGSLAGFVLVVPVLLASTCLVPAGARWMRFALPLSILTVVAGIVFILTGPVTGSGLETDASSAVTSRIEIWQTTAAAIDPTFPVGSGLGSFEDVYRQHENRSLVTTTYINHAHNDYLELVLELGLAGILLIAAFLTWWLLATVKIWKSRVSTPMARAATIATAAVLVHSIVDFPLRTAAISAIFAACLGMMVQYSRGSSEPKNGELRPTRHVELG